MYQRFFELQRRPFASTPDPKAYFGAPMHEEALALLKYCVKEGDGIGVLLGEPGVGKTLLCHLLLESLGSAISPVFITNTHLSSIYSMLQAILYDLNLPYEGLGEQECRLRLTDYLLQRFSDGGRTLIFIDEAQHLSPEQLEELRMLTNLESASEHAVSALVIGQPGLEEKLRIPELECLRQRIAVVAKLGRLDTDQVVEYVRAKIAYAGGSADSIFTASALSEICERSEGVPRRINQLCHRSMLLAFANESGTVDAPHIESAASQLFAMETRQTSANSHHRSVEVSVQAPARALLDDSDVRLERNELSSVMEVGAPVRASKLPERETKRTKPSPPVPANDPLLAERVPDRPTGVSRLRQIMAR